MDVDDKGAFGGITEKRWEWEYMSFLLPPMMSVCPPTKVGQLLAQNFFHLQICYKKRDCMLDYQGKFFSRGDLQQMLMSWTY